eukprot:gene29618-17898_t
MHGLKKGIARLCKLSRNLSIKLKMTHDTQLMTEIKSMFQEFKTELKTEIAELKTELKTEIAELKTELKLVIFVDECGDVHCTYMWVVGMGGGPAGRT